ncbi:MAG: cytochrome-c oxidase, cbb3-type subunit II [Pseudomonadales bacterium]
MKHDAIEKNVGLLIGLVLVAVSFGGMVEIFPLVFDQAAVKPIDGLKPLTAVQLEGRDIYMREGCAVCHTQMVRSLQSETARYGHYSVAGEDAYEHPFLWGSKRTGPDLARVGGRYSDEWHRAHLANPRNVVPTSNMPSFPWLFENVLDGEDTAAKMRVLRTLGVPYTDADIAGAQQAVSGTTEAEALIAYLQNLGLDMRNYTGTSDERQ